MRGMHLTITVSTLILAGAGVTAPSNAYGQVNAPAGIGVGASLDVESIEPDESGRDLPRSPGSRIWVAKFLCGEISAAGSPQVGSPLAPGSYRTAINVFNGQILNPADFTITLALAVDPSEVQRFESGGNVTVEALAAVELDCDFIRRSVANVPPAAFLKGFIRLATSRRADGDSRLVKVIAVYTLKNVENPAALPNPQLD